MTSVVFPAAVLFGDGLPDVCCITGKPSRERMRVTFSTTRHPAFVVVVALFTWVGGLIAYFVLHASAMGTMAMAPEVWKRRRQARRRTLTVAAVGAAGVVLGLLLGVVALWAAGLLVALSSLGVHRRLRRTYLPRATVYKDGPMRLVRLDGVHPAFVAAVTGQPQPSTLAAAAQ